jgi:hypothetical protein
VDYSVQAESHPTRGRSIRGESKVKLDLHRPEGVELHIPSAGQRVPPSRSGKARLIAGGIAAGGFIYLLTQLSTAAALTILGALSIAVVGLVGVAVWGMNNSPW